MPALGQARRVPRLIHSDDLPSVEGELFGRKNELQLLDSALADPKMHIVQLVASGGTGKTKLIRSWLDSNSEQIEALIAWSFYSQGASEDKQISATPFFIQALQSLDSEKSVSDFNTEEEKGEYVANLLREKRCLLVLDGLEPLQQAGHGMRGELKDRAIRKMLRCLVNSHTSLCIITTRLKVHELQRRKQVVSHDLQNLQPEDGLALLRSFGVNGRDVDILAAVEEYGRHALALHLLGNALATYLEGDIRRRDTLTELIGDYDDTERHAFKVMQAYEHWLAGTPELKLLYLLGLFDHPVEQEVLEVLWDAEIPTLTADVPKKAWQVAQRDLTHKYRMMSVHGNHQDLFDTHPLIREYFGARLKVQQGEIWRQAHTVLYEYYQGLPEKLYGKYLPDTLEEMQPLFRAVAHGCFANLHKQVWNEVYWTRIERNKAHGELELNDDSYNANCYLFAHLGGINDNLSVIVNFFDAPWSRASSQISTVSTGTLFNRAGLFLSSLGRTKESITPMKEAISISNSIKDWGASVVGSYTLSETLLQAGDLKSALENTRSTIFYAEQKEYWQPRVAAYCSTGHAMHMAGYFSYATEFFEKAEKCQKAGQGIYFLYSVQGFHYCNLLIDLKKCKEAKRRSKQATNYGKKLYHLLSFALDELILGRAWLVEGNLKQSKVWFEKAVNSLRATSDINYLCMGLIQQTQYLVSAKNYILSYENLSEIYELAEPSSMRLHLTDYHLEMARLILAVEADPKQYPEATPNHDQRILPFADPDEPGILTLQGHIAEAERLINATGYHRRDAELAELKQQVGLN